MSNKIRTTYPHGSAGRYMEIAVPVSFPQETAAEILRKLAEAAKEWESLTYIYVLNTEKTSGSSTDRNTLWRPAQ